MSKLWNQRVFCIVTGASQGIGQQFAVEFARKFDSQSVMLLLARSGTKLEETSKLIQKANPGVFVTYQSVDLSDPDPREYQHIIKEALFEFKVQPGFFSTAVVIHNVGSLGDVSEFASEISDPSKLNKYFSLNLYSVCSLNSSFLGIFNDESILKYVINVTSLAAVKPLKSMGYYCMGKAAREMYFKVLAEENPTLRVLSYSPGPVDTNMQIEIVENIKDEEVKQMFIGLRENNQLLSLEQTTKRIIQILTDDAFTSGERVDYYDTHC